VLFKLQFSDGLLDRFLRIADLLSKRKHSDARIEKILGVNFDRLLKDVWQD
jgi:microsomal dipeptidase-like Zn-dependent dipeptidase